MTDSWQNEPDMQLFRPFLRPNPSVLLLQPPRQTFLRLVRSQRFLRCRPSVSTSEPIGFSRGNHCFPTHKPMDSAEQTDGIFRTNRWGLQNKPMVSALNWWSRGLSSGWSMRPWPLRKMLEKRCFYVCRAPNLSLYHPICHPICHQLNNL